MNDAHSWPAQLWLLAQWLWEFLKFLFSQEGLPWLILFLPLLAAITITVFTQKKARVSAALSVGAICISLLGAFVVLMGFVGNPTPRDTVLIWLSLGRLHIDFGLHVDQLSLVMALVVTGVGTAIHFYSIRYMGGDRGFGRFFASLSLFTFSMLGLVLSNNFLQMFIFWELVGLCSYLLIGFWYERASAADAAKKAFLTNRVGDFGFLTGIILVWATTGTLTFADVQNQMHNNPEIFGAATTAAGLLIFSGAVGKSAQFPLHVWLPDAMEGPTPVSALIHAATMVAAGVYMLCRVFFLFDDTMLTVIAWVGGFTALMSALIAVQQDDIKRILAYSTVSQLGYMMMAVGLNSPPVAMFHLVAHAFFKALLFLAAGAVIYGMHHEQDIWKMGRLYDKLPLTFRVFLVAALALCGMWPLSGFFSKDAILALAYRQNLPLFELGVVVAFLTTFYIFRLVFVVFFGHAKSEVAAKAHAVHANIIAYPLVLLAIGSILAGFFGVTQFLGPQFFAEDRTPVFAPFEPFIRAPQAAWLGLGVLVLALAGAWALYGHASSDPLPRVLPGITKVLRNKFYFDELYAGLIAMTQDALAVCADWFDRWMIAGLLVRGTHGTTEVFGRALRLMQTGNLQTYTFLLAAGVAAVIYFVLVR
jgi:NADH-quinone oxidoreductase subunit L